MLGIKVEHDFDHEEGRTLNEYLGFFEDESLTVGHDFTGSTLTCAVRHGKGLNSELLCEPEVKFLDDDETSGQIYLYLADDAIEWPIKKLYFDVMEDDGTDKATIAYGVINVHGSEKSNVG